MTFVRRGVALAVTALVLTGCGVRPTGVVDAGEPASGLTKGLRIYFVSETGRLEGVSRPDERVREPAAVIKLLMTGPDESERRSGLTTLVRSGQFDVTGDGDRLTVRISDLTLDPASVNDRNYTGQLVCSLARAQAVLDKNGRTRPDDVRVTVRAIPPEGVEQEGELGPYVCSDFLK
ncbi:hypothetical protein [Streptomyces kanamyceticus]|uniref:GerMN domain-containing protein n=1 Tax=Streptomyces kanamyceticus TaxID=1967 RepID=A0A5J6GAH2_STRKN|nr:hypothetical protein [Streptomyces kanamyceticus]QEU92780.1 hypothetical protein CP970_19355 [Streptomyces kanamyceticus]